MVRPKSIPCCHRIHRSARLQALGHDPRLDLVWPALLPVGPDVHPAVAEKLHLGRHRKTPAQSPSSAKSQISKAAHTVEARTRILCSSQGRQTLHQTEGTSGGRSRPVGANTLPGRGAFARDRCGDRQSTIPAIGRFGGPKTCSVAEGERGERFPRCLTTERQSRHRLPPAPAILAALYPELNQKKGALSNEGRLARQT